MGDKKSIFEKISDFIGTIPGATEKQDKEDQEEFENWKDKWGLGGKE